MVTGEERERVWPLLLRVWPAYDTYAGRAGRDIRVFVLEPADQDGSPVAGKERYEASRASSRSARSAGSRAPA